MEKLPFVVLFLMFATLAVLVVGLIFMAIGGKKDKKYSTKLMVARVVLQAAAVFMLFLIYYITKS